MDEKAIAAAEQAFLAAFHDMNIGAGQPIRAAIAAYRDAEVERLTDENAEARETLAHTDIGSLPHDWTLKDVAEARLHDMLKLRDQVRDTCVRAEKAEAKLEAAERVVKRYRWLCDYSDFIVRDSIRADNSQEFDDAIDAAMRNYYAARGGERGL